MNNFQQKNPSLDSSSVSVSTFDSIERLLRAYYWVIKSISERRGMLHHTLRWTQGLLMSCSPLMYQRRHDLEERNERVHLHHDHRLVRCAEEQLYGVCKSPCSHLGYLGQLLAGSDISLQQIEGNLDNVEHEFSMSLLRELSVASQLAELTGEIHRIAEQGARALEAPPSIKVMEDLELRLGEMVTLIREEATPEPFKSALASAGVSISRVAARLNTWLACLQLSGSCDVLSVQEMRVTLGRVAEDMQRMTYLVILEINRLSLLNLRHAKIRVRRSDLDVIQEHVRMTLESASRRPSGRWTPGLRRCLMSMDELSSKSMAPQTALRVLLVEHEAAVRLLRVA